jgi:hypothetical protein
LEPTKHAKRATMVAMIKLTSAGKQSKGHSVIPNRVPFDQWKMKVRRTITPANSAGKAFKPWMSHLEIVYDLTRPLLASEADRKAHAHLRTALLEISRTLRNVIGEIDDAGSKVIPKGGWMEFKLDGLQQKLADARKESLRVVRMVLKRKEQEPKVYTHCMPFICQLRDAGVGIEDIAGICMVVMQAHGFTRTQLSVFSPSSVSKNKTLQKAIVAHDNKRAAVIQQSIGKR